jgi:hypothetical protein
MILGGGRMVMCFLVLVCEWDGMDGVGGTYENNIMAKRTK